MESQENVYHPLVLCGPSGVGKGTLIDRLTQSYPTLFDFSVSCTTRKPRAGEQNGIHYHFISVEEFKQRRDNHEFVESNEVHGNFYGTLRAEIERIQKLGKICVLDIDIGGAKQIFASGLQSVYVFVSAPSREELERRLRTRGTESEETLSVRLRNGEKEIEESRALAHMFSHYLVNDQLDTAFEELQRLLRSHYPQLR